MKQVALILSIISINAAAVPSPRIESKLDFVLHGGEARSFSVSWRDGKVYVGDRRLPGTGAILGRRALAQTLKVRRLGGPRPVCAAGTYFHKVVKDGVETAESGCVTESSFDPKVRAFRRLVKLAWSLPPEK